MLNGLKGVVNVSVARNRIRNIADGAFVGLDRLEYLNLSWNSIRQLRSSNVLTPVPLKVLDLSRNRLSAIERDAFIHLIHLEELSLRHNAIQFLDRGIFGGLFGLKTLSVANNHISAIAPDTFAELHSLIRLDLSDNSLAQITGDMFGLRGLPLRQLFLRKNYLKTIPGDTFHAVPYIEVLSLSHNQIAKFTDNLFVPLKSLRKLDINNNEIIEISKAVLEEVEKVVEFNFKRNRLTYLPEINAASVNWKKISLEGNPWQCPCLFGILKSLSKRRIDFGTQQNPFYMGWNPICSTTPVEVCFRSRTLAEREGIIRKYEEKLHFSPDDYE